VKDVAHQVHLVDVENGAWQVAAHHEEDDTKEKARAHTVLTEKVISIT
jgi:hypothetical protein